VGIVWRSLPHVGDKLGLIPWLDPGADKHAKKLVAWALLKSASPIHPHGTRNRIAEVESSKEEIQMTLSRSTHWRAAILMAASASFLVYAQSKLPADLDPQSRARLPYLKKSDMDANGQKLLEVFRSKDDTLRGPLAFAAYNAAVAQALFELHNAAVGGTLDPHTRELAIMVACRETNYNLEWNGHEATALKAGIDPQVLDVVRYNRPLDGLSEKDAVVIRFGRQMLRDKKVDSATFAKAVEIWNKRGTMDMVAVMNTYAVSGYFAIAVDEHSPKGKAELPAAK
jgi:4-carboxymuconolactone decarboxylase